MTTGPTPTPTFVGCTHGTRDAEGQRAVRGLIDAIAAARPDVPVVGTYVDVQHPQVAPVVAGIAGPSVVVPLLLTAGYHVHVDIAGAVARPAQASAADVLGLDPRLTAMLLDRVRGVGATPDDHVVLAATGSSDAGARAQIEAAALALGEAWGQPVSVAYVAAGEPHVADVVVEHRRQRDGRRIVLVSYLLAPGVFWRRLFGVGADLVTPTLLHEPGEETAANLGVPDPRLVDLAWDRFDTAAAPHERLIVPDSDPCRGFSRREAATRIRIGGAGV